MYVFKQKLLLKKKYHLLGALLTLFFVTACNDDKNNSGLIGDSAKPLPLLSTPSTLVSDNANNVETADSPDEIKTWDGQYYGFVTSDNPANNKVEALIALGKIKAATISYRSTSIFLNNQANDNDVKIWRIHAASSINKETLDIYDTLDVLFSKYNIKPFRDSLEVLAKPETIEIYTRIGNDKLIRQKRNEIAQMTRVISGTVLNAVLVLAPSRKEYMLAGSVMLNESGRILQQGLSADGKITDASMHQLGISQIDGALSLIPEFAINMCEKQRQISQTYRDNTNEIVEQLISFDNKPAQAGVNDIFALARQTENMARTLPEEDQDICK